MMQQSKKTIVVALEDMLEKRSMTMTERSLKGGITMDNMSILENGKAKPIRYPTLQSLCEIVDCQLVDILKYY